MIVVNQFRQTDFLRLGTYLVWGERGTEPERVAWTAARNLPTDDPELAAQLMRATAAQSARVEKPVYQIVVGFVARDPVDRELMERVADRVLERLGLSEHQAILVAHRDRPHPHVHIMVNRVHPFDGRAWNTWQDWPRARDVVLEEERRLGWSRPDFGKMGRRRESEQLWALASDIRAYEQVTTLTREHYQAQVAASAAVEPGPERRLAPTGAPRPMEVDGAATRVARIRAQLRALPDLAELERRIGRQLHYVGPRYIRRMRAFLTAPQLALAKELRRVARDLALGREEERHEHSR